MDRLLNVDKGHKVALSINDVLEIKPMAGSIVIRIYFKNNYDMRVKIKSLTDKLSPKPSVLNIYHKQKLIKTQSVTSSVRFLTEPGAQTSTTPTTPQTSTQTTNPKTGMSGATYLPSDFGVKKLTVIKCGIESKNTKVDKNGYLVPVESYNDWRDCTPGCKTNNCHNCEDGPNYVDPTNVVKLAKLGYIDTPQKDLKKTNFVSGYPKQTKMDDVKKCYQKTMDECHASRDCFYCVSSQPKNVKNCTAIGANGDYICDSQFSSACVLFLTKEPN